MSLLASSQPSPYLEAPIWTAEIAPIASDAPPKGASKAGALVKELMGSLDLNVKSPEASGSMHKELGNESFKVGDFKNASYHYTVVRTLSTTVPYTT
eukprot:9240830-Pyramimonas_sp.AAC.1